MPVVEDVCDVQSSSVVTAQADSGCRVEHRIGRDLSAKDTCSPGKRIGPAVSRERAAGARAYNTAALTRLGAVLAVMGWSGKSRRTSKVKCEYVSSAVQCAAGIPCRQIEPGPRHFAVIGQRQSGENWGAIRIIRHHGEQVWREHGGEAAENDRLLHGIQRGRRLVGPIPRVDPSKAGAHLGQEAGDEVRIRLR